jgi:membrane protein implicated in regulation of membrane protease activity
VLGIVTQAQRVQARLKSLVQLNIELAKVEGKRKAIALGIALGLAGLAAVLVLYAVGFLFAAAAVGIAEELPLWLSLLIVAIVLLAFAVIAVLVAAHFAKKISPPSEALEESKRTVETVKSHA